MARKRGTTPPGKPRRSGIKHPRYRPTRNVRPNRIIFVYNEDSGLFNAVAGWAHKALSPATYQCALCRITFGLTGMMVPWKSYLERLPFPVTFVHRDEFRVQFPEQATTALPVILAERSGRTEALLSAQEINAAGGLLALLGRLEERLERQSHET